ncbi:MAG: permease [Planctomycetota bacterium]|nr:permease [Planctomycetota bacterium]
MSEPVFWSVVLRCGQALLQSAPFILCGLFVAAIFRRLLGQENTRRLFGGGGWKGLVLGWLMGMLLPVCSLGVLPVVREMRRAGLPGGTILAFALAAPLFNPLSLLYGLTLSEPFTILAFALCSLLVVSLVGAIWDWWFPATESPEPPPPQVPYGLRRLLSLATAMGRDATGVSALLIAIGFAGVGLLAAVLPPGSLQRSMNHDVATSFPVATWPASAWHTRELGMMFQHGNSVGAAFVLLALGAGMNLGTVAWMIRAYGVRRALGWFALLLIVVLGLSYGIDKPLFPKGADLADHTHAFDGYCQAYHPGSTGLGKATVDRIQRDLQYFELQSMQLLGVLVALGIGQRVARLWFDLESWLERPAATPTTVSRFDVIVSPSIVGGVILLGVIAFSVVGCYAYYPPPSEVFEELFVAQGEALGSANPQEAEHSLRWIEILDDWSRKLEVGVYLRTGDVSPYHRMKGKLLREKLELLEHEVKDGDWDQVRRLKPQISLTLSRLKRAYLEEQ